MKKKLAQPERADKAVTIRLHCDWLAAWQCQLEGYDHCNAKSVMTLPVVIYLGYSK
jgi:hypothetical protein